MSNEVVIGECISGSFQNQASYDASSSCAQREARKSAASTWKDLKARRRPRGNSAAGNKARWNKRPSNIDTMKPTKRTLSAIEEAANKVCPIYRCSNTSIANVHLLSGTVRKPVRPKPKPGCFQSAHIQ